MTMTSKDAGKTYARAATGDALTTINEHPITLPQDIVLFGACFCPFVQRVWVVLEALGIPYSYYEVDIYKTPKPDDLLAVSPRGLVPALKLQHYTPPRALNESTVIMEYLEDLAAATAKRSLLPPKSDPYARAIVRLVSDNVNRSFVPSFYKFLQSQEPDAQIQSAQDFRDALDTLVSLLHRAEREITDGGSTESLGLWIENNVNLGWVDVMAGPWLFRATNVLKHYRSFEMSSGARFDAYLHRLFNHPHFKVTCSTESLYLDSYERYAFNRPNTSQVADAINAGKGLP